jgi:hypothetical protein
MKRAQSTTQSTPAQRHTPTATPRDTVRTLTIPAGVIYVLGFGCMALALIAALLRGAQ